MLRHLRTLHRANDLSCESCSKKFVRRDNLNRHIAEQHSTNDHFITCELCHKRMSKRSLPEHLESRTCKASRTKVREHFSNPADDLASEDERDCFPLTIQVLKVWLSLTYNKGNQSLEEQSPTDGLNSQPFSSLNAYYRCCSLGNKALDSMKEQMEDSMEPQHSLKLFYTAMLWVCISLVGGHRVKDVPIGFRDWDAHLKGAAALLEVFHSSSCDCDKYLLCQKLQQRAGQDPAMLHFKSIVRETRLVAVLLRVLPSLVQECGDAICLLDVLVRYILDEFDQRGKDCSGYQTVCEAKGIEVDPQRNRGREAMIWAVFKDTGG